AVAVEIRDGECRPSALKHIEVHFLASHRPNLDRFTVLGQKEHALFVEARRLAAKVAVKEDAALVSTVEEIEPAIAVEIGELSKHPAIAARGRMLNAISWRQENDRLKLAGPLAQVNRQAAEDIRLAIAIPIEELDAKRRQRGAAPRA